MTVNPKQIAIASRKITSEKTKLLKEAVARKKINKPIVSNTARKIKLTAVEASVVLATFGIIGALTYLTVSTLSSLNKISFEKDEDEEY